jgi:hypothetical protein
MLALILLLFAQFTVPTHTGALASGGGSPCALPFTDSFTGTGALGSPCWTQTTAGGYVNMVMSSGTVTSASAGRSMALETGSGTATTQSIKAVFNGSGGGTSYLVVHGDVAGQNSYQWQFLAGEVYAENAGVLTSVGYSAIPSPGDNLLLQISGKTITIQNLTTAELRTFVVPDANVVASGYAGLETDTTNYSHSFGPATVN